ncbi:hypothetical protein [Candidatus Marithrix sp. Canyon 246]|uniref:hypothetical protein n=1 Tax=Candidatus Marithrix sp. Canyon 246 TaxID=1827136 RepID=UPI00084A0F29|nr:hypothetical protein [Candidatus Marithrix sp. Canyon 246]
MKTFRCSGIELDPLTGLKKKPLKCIFSSEPKNGKRFNIVSDENRFFDYTVIILFYRRLLFKIKVNPNYYRYKFIIQAKKLKIQTIMEDIKDWWD